MPVQYEDSEPATDDSEELNKAIILLNPSQTSTIAVLGKGFDLHRMPTNYLTNRSAAEKIIFQATMSDTNKSVFSWYVHFCRYRYAYSFSMANDYLPILPTVDVLTNAKSLKCLARLALNPGQRLSLMVHRLGNTCLIDNFDIDSFLLSEDNVVSVPVVTSFHGVCTCTSLIMPLRNYDVGVIFLVSLISFSSYRWGGGTKCCQQLFQNYNE